MDLGQSNLLLALLTANISTTKARLFVLSELELIVCFLARLVHTQYHYEGTWRRWIDLGLTRKSQAT